MKIKQEGEIIMDEITQEGCGFQVRRMLERKLYKHFCFHRISKSALQLFADVHVIYSPDF